jgi:glutamyl-tRNA reductase
MNVLVVGMSHRTAQMSVLERAAVRGDEVAKILDELLGCANVAEAVLVSTCNRVEVYVVVEAFHAGLADTVGVLARHAGVDPAMLHEHLYVHYAAAAAEHVFRVAAGLDSMVVGESQVLGQVRAAYRVARESRTVGRVLHELIQQSLRIGKRVQAETGLAQMGRSVVSEALSDADTLLGGLAGRRALIVGAGSMGALTAAALRRAGAGQVVIANRTADNGARLAAALREQGVPSRSVNLIELTGQITEADVVVTCSSAVDALVETDSVRAALRVRGPGRALVVCDLGLPRDVEPGVAELPGVTVIDLESLQRRLRAAPCGLDTGRAGEIVTEELRAFLVAQRSAEVTPTVTALRRRAAEVVDNEMLRLSSRLPDLDRSIREELERTVRRVVDKLLHAPTVRIKQLASGPGGAGYAEALRELFQLDPQAPTAIARPAGADESDVDGEAG